MEVRRARVPLLPARRRPCDRRRCGSRRRCSAGGWRSCHVVDPQIAALLGLDRDERLRRRRAGGAGVLAVVTPNDIEPWIDADPTRARRRGPRRPVARQRQRAQPGACRLADHRGGGAARPARVAPSAGVARRPCGSGVRPTGTCQLRRNPPCGAATRAAVDGARARDHPPASQRRGVRRALDAAARGLPVDAGPHASATAPAGTLRAVGRDRLAAAGASRAVRASRRRPDAGRLRLPARPVVLDEWRAAMRPIPLGTVNDPNAPNPNPNDPNDRTFRNDLFLLFRST